MKKVKSVLQRITTGVLALIFTVTLAVPKAKAVTGVDDVSVGIMAVLVHLDSIGGSLAVQQGTALATQNAVTALATQAGAAGALGAGVTGTAALASIGGACVAAAAGGFTIGYVGYQQLSKLAEWIRQAKLTGTAENKIFQTGGPYDTLLNGDPVEFTTLDFGRTYFTQGGSSFTISNIPQPDVSSQAIRIATTLVSSDNIISIANADYPTNPASFSPSTKTFVIHNASQTSLDIKVSPEARSGISALPSAFTSQNPDWSKNVFVPDFDAPIQEKQEVVYAPPATWSPPAPTPGQDVYYNPYPNAPQKPIKEIVEDVPKDIYDKKFDPAPPQVVEPTVPPVNPDLPPVVNPNPPVDSPAEVQPYTVQLGDVFPFCIPFDLYHMVTLFVAEPEAPHAKWEFSLPFAAGTYKVEWDLQEWDEVAALCRKMELILFCVGLAVVTYKLIKW